MRTFHLLLPLLFLLISSCKLKIVGSEGGALISESGTYSCEAGNTGTIEVVDTSFSDSEFYATSQPLKAYVEACEECTFLGIGLGIGREAAHPTLISQCDVILNEHYVSSLLAVRRRRSIALVRVAAKR